MAVTEPRKPCLRWAMTIWKRPVPWIAVILSYMGIFAGVVLEWRWSQHARQNIVATGQQSIRNSCHFDNERTKELRAILVGEGRRDLAATITFRDCVRAASILSESD